jgi:hypothetical protein
LLYLDVSTNELTLKVHDDSADTTAESAVIASVTSQGGDGTAPYPFSGAIRHSDGHLIATWITAYDPTAATHGVADINGTASITAKTAIASGVDDHYWPALFIDQNTDDIYVGYGGKRDGSEVLGTSMNTWYTKSEDGGTTWTAGDTAYSETAATLTRQVRSTYMGDRFLLFWFDGTNMQTNAVRSLDLEPPPPPAASGSNMTMLMGVG